MFERNKIAMIMAEVVGTAILTLSILATSKSAIGIPYFVALGAGLTLALIVLMVGSVSGAHVNPAVTLGMWTLRKIDTAKAIVYIAAQFLGAVLAWQLYVYFVDRSLQNIAGSEFDWRILIAEVVGTFIFTFGIASAVYQKYDAGRSAATIGGSFALGILAAGIISNGLLNPAVALGVQSWSVAYVAGPIIGSVIGMNLYALLFATNGSLKLAVAKPVAKKASAKKSTRRKK